MRTAATYHADVVLEFRSMDAPGEPEITRARLVLDGRGFVRVEQNS